MLSQQIKEITQLCRPVFLVGHSLPHLFPNEFTEATTKPMQGDVQTVARQADTHGEVH